MSLFTCMIYLNDNFEGGATMFKGIERLDGVTGDISVEPSAGTLLLFWHPQPHKAQPITKGTKYVLRTDVMYRVKPQTTE